ncbi:hypothetical protein N665_0077s0025 [Sinapis alba]|nr:hypothetical protein N665_0077s0025 [Sinapis alba]
MDTNPSSRSEGTSISIPDRKKLALPSCRCGRTTKPTVSWTDENPCRRFFRCPLHGFYGWLDVDKPGGWQKASLIEARDQIRRLEDEIRRLKLNAEETSQQAKVSTGSQELSVAENHVLVKREDEIGSFCGELSKSKEREKMLREFILISWGVFFLATAIIVTMMKK